MVFSLLTPIMWYLFQHFSSIPTSIRCPTIRFNSDTNHLELVSDITGFRPQSHRTAFISEANHKCQVTILWPTSYKSGVPNNPPLSSHNFPEQLLTGLRKPLLHLQLITKGKNKQPDKQVHGARFRKVPNPGASVLMELGHTILPAQACVQQLRNSRNFTEEFLCRLYYIGWAD